MPYLTAVLHTKALHATEADSRKAASRFSQGMEDIIVHVCLYTSKTNYLLLIGYILSVVWTSIKGNEWVAFCGRSAPKCKQTIYTLRISLIPVQSKRWCQRSHTTISLLSQLLDECSSQGCSRDGKSVGEFSLGTGTERGWGPQARWRDSWEGWFTCQV